MKSFFKKLSLVLAAAMIITMIPATGVKAANLVTIGVDKTTAGQEITLDKIGDTTAKLNFYGATGYAAAKDAKTKVWKSSNEKVATVDNGVVTAVGYGSANISLSVTVSASGLTYAGTVKVTVKAPAVVTATPEVSATWAKQTAWNAVTITFASEAAAKAAKVTVNRVKLTTTGKEYLLDVKPSTTVSGNTVTVAGLTDGVTYRFQVSSLGSADITMHTGDPAVIWLSYGDATIGSDKDITGVGNKSAAVTPEVKVYDENGVSLDYDSKKLKFSTDKTQNKSVTFSTTGGKIKYNSADSKCYVKVVYEFTNSAGVKESIEDSGVFSPIAYVAPSLGGFVEQIVLTAADKNKVTFASDCTYEGEMNVDDTMYIAYYFLGTDGNKYVGDESYLKGGKDYKTLYSNNYKFYLVKDDEESNVLSLKDNKVVALSEGTERICLYQMTGSKQNPISDILYGVIDITVNEESVPYQIVMTSDTDFAGTTNTRIEDYQTAKVTFQVLDQYEKDYGSTPYTVYKINGDGQRVKAEGVVVDTQVGSDSNAGKTDKNGKATITITYDQVVQTKSELTTYEIVLNKNTSETAEFTVTVDEIPAVDGEDVLIGYEVEAVKGNITNAAIWNATAANAVGETIKVVRLVDGFKYDYVDFTVIGDSDLVETEGYLAKHSGLAGSMLNKRYVVFTDSNGDIVTETKAGTIQVSSGTGADVKGSMTIAEAISKGTISASGQIVTYYTEEGKLDTGKFVYIDAATAAKYTQAGEPFYVATGTLPTGAVAYIATQLSQDSSNLTNLTAKTTLTKASDLEGIHYYVTSAIPTSGDGNTVRLYAMTGASAGCFVATATYVTDTWKIKEDADIVNKDIFNAITALTEAEAKTYFNGAAYKAAKGAYDDITDYVGNTAEDAKYAAIKDCKLVSVDDLYNAKNDYNSAAQATYLFDTYANGDVLDILTGDYTATLYTLRTSGSDGYSFESEASVDFTVSNEIKGISKISYTEFDYDTNGKLYDLKNKDGKLIYTWTSGFSGADTDENVKSVVTKIMNSFNVWFDKDNNGKASLGEVGTFEDVFMDIATVELTDYSAVVGADGASIYIKSVDYEITFKDTESVIKGTYEPKALFTK